MIYNYDENLLYFKNIDSRDPNEFVVPGKFRIEWQAIGEGLFGDYNADNPLDVELLRFYISKWRPDADDVPDHGDWEDIDDASCCTDMPVTITA